MKNLKSKLVFLLISVSLLLICNNAKSTDYSEGKYSNYPWSPQSGDIVDKEGTAHNIFDEFLSIILSSSLDRNESILGNYDTEISTEKWTFIISTDSAHDRSRVWIDLYNDNDNSVLINFTTNPLTLPPTYQGLTMVPLSTPWEINISSNIHPLIIGLEDVVPGKIPPEKIHSKELK